MSGGSSNDFLHTLHGGSVGRKTQDGVGTPVLLPDPKTISSDTRQFPEPPDISRARDLKAAQQSCTAVLLGS